MPQHMNIHNDICLDFMCLYFINVNGLTFELKIHQRNLKI